MSCISLVVIGMIVSFMVGCDKKSESPTSPADQASSADADVSSTPETSIDKAEVEVQYFGGETENSLIKSLPEFEKALNRKLTDREKQEMIESFRQEMKAHPEWSNQTTAKGLSGYGAYAAHYKNDADLWLEYKWWVGSRNPGYYMYSASYALYWAVQRCYRGRIWNWPWKEGGYKRVTAVVGNCVNIPFASWPDNWYLKTYLRVVAY